MANQKQLKREGRAIWEPRYHQWQASGLSKSSFCKQHGIKPTNFYIWCAVFRKDPPPVGARGAGESGVKPTFVPVMIRDSAPILKIQCSDVTLSCGASIDYLQEQLSLLRSKRYQKHSEQLRTLQGQLFDEAELDTGHS